MSPGQQRFKYIQMYIREKLLIKLKPARRDKPSSPGFDPIKASKDAKEKIVHVSQKIGECVCVQEIGECV